MSYDLTVWEGPGSATDVEAVELYQAVIDRIEAGVSETPTPAIRAFVEALVDKWPDITTSEGADSPWASGPLIDEADGNAVCLSIVWDRCAEVSEFTAQLAREHRLFCFDPQTDSMRSTGGDSTATEVSSAGLASLFRRIFGRR